MFHTPFKLPLKLQTYFVWKCNAHFNYTKFLSHINPAGINYFQLKFSHQFHANIYQKDLQHFSLKHFFFSKNLTKNALPYNEPYNTGTQTHILICHILSYLNDKQNQKQLTIFNPFTHLGFVFFRTAVEPFDWKVQINTWLSQFQSVAPGSTHPTEHGHTYCQCVPEFVCGCVYPYRISAIF